MPIDIKGKPYTTVAERLKIFREKYPDYSLLTEIIELTDERVVMKATISYGDGILADGIAYEDKDSTFINKTSFIENCQTSAWGRALANFMGSYDDVASADEVLNAIAQKEDLPWLSQKDFDAQVNLLNREPDKQKRAEHFKSLQQRYRMKRTFSEQFREIVEQRDINV